MNRQGAKVPVWDIGVRLSHWLLAALVCFSWWAAKSDHLAWHRLSGYTILGLLVFRLIWGFVGSSTARFAQFVKGPRAVIAYARGAAPATLGHNALGALSVLAMLGVLATQVGLGLFAVDENSLDAGPLSKFVSFDTGRAIAHLHHRLFWVLLALIMLHLAAIGVYALRRRNLVAPMISGRGAAPTKGEAPRFAPLWRMFAAAALATTVAWFVSHGLRF